MRKSIHAALIYKTLQEQRSSNHTSYIKMSLCKKTGKVRMNEILTLILPRSRTGTVWFYTSTSNKRAARPKLYTVINKGLKTYV